MDTKVFYHVSIKAVVLDESGKLLLAKDDTGKWDIPGGKIEHGESIKECLEREIKEELGVDGEMTDERPLFMWPGTNNDGSARFTVGFAAKLKSMDFQVSNENVEHGFFGKDDIQNINIYDELKELSNWLKS